MYFTYVDPGLRWEPDPNDLPLADLPHDELIVTEGTGFWYQLVAADED